MKTAVSLPDDLFTAADALARKLGVSRSSLVASALAEYVAKHKHARVSERLNSVYATEDNRPDPRLSAAQQRALRRTDW